MRTFYTVDDLYKFCKENNFSKFSSKEHGNKPLVLQSIESFEADKQEELEQVGLTQEDKELIKNCFCVVKKYVDIKKKIDYPRYNMFEYSSKQLDNLKVSLLNFLKYLDDIDSLNLSYETLENYLHKENFLDVLEEMTYKLISSTSKSEMERTLIGISFLLAKVRIGITDSTALQTIEITKYNSFFCSQLCSVKSFCDNYKNFVKENKDDFKPKKEKKDEFDIFA